MNIRRLDLNLQIRLIGETLMSILNWMYTPFMLIYFKESFGASIAGKMMMIPPFFGVIATLLGGYIADRFGRKRIMLISLSLQSSTLFIFALNISPWLDFFSFLAINVLTMLYRPASSAMVADLVQIEDRRSVFALFYAATNLGVVIGPIFGAFFFYHYRQQLITVSALITLVLFIIMKFLLKETLPLSAKIESQKKKGIKLFTDIFMVFKDKVFFIYILAGSIITSVFMQFNTYLAIYVSENVPTKILRLGNWDVMIQGKQLFGWMVAENGFFVVMFSLLVSRLTRQWSDQKGLIISSIMFGASLWLMSFTHNPLILILLMGTFSIGELIRTPIVQNFVVKIAPEEKRGQYLGASSLQFSIGRMLAPLTVIISASFSPYIVFSVILLVSIIAALIYWQLFNSKLMTNKMSDQTGSF